jgi:hypothetical protein
MRESLTRVKEVLLIVYFFSYADRGHGICDLRLRKDGGDSSTEGNEGNEGDDGTESAWSI